MHTIQIFDPPLCCSSGVCGTEVDQALVDFAAAVAWAKRNGAHIERFNLAQEPLAFTQNPTVAAFLARSGAEALPLVLLNGQITLAGRYPHRGELARWADLPFPGKEAAPGGCCSGGSCG